MPAVIAPDALTLERALEQLADAQGGARSGRRRWTPRAQTGEIAEWPSPSGPDSHPYALAYAGGAIWYNESGVRPDALVRFDPATETFQSWVIPSGNVYGGIVRHMRRTRDGNLLIHQTSTNRIILVTLPQTPATN